MFGKLANLIRINTDAIACRVHLKSSIKIRMFVTLALVSPSVLSADNSDSIAKIFSSEGVIGTLVIASDNGSIMSLHNEQRAQTRFSPASTFKIPNTLIALKAGVVESSNSKFEWDGINRGVPMWNRDHTLKTAFKASCVWCYQSIALKVGEARYQNELKSIAYGNQSIGDGVDPFWLSGALKISALEQIEFLKGVVNSTLPFEDHHLQVLKSVMFDEDSKTYKIYAKSGWTGSKQSVGWYVGYLETGGNTYLFAFNMVMDNIEKAPLRRKIVWNALRALDLLN